VWQEWERHVSGPNARQLNEITTEMAAITDGRSLHRRLALSEETTTSRIS